jgi:hypothetical protein
MLRIVFAVFFLVMVGVNSVLFAVIIYNRPCLTLPAGTTSGGESCKNVGCTVEESGGGCYRVDAVSYKACGRNEYVYNCDEGTGYPPCAYQYRYNNMADCLGNTNGSTGKRYNSERLTCR